MIAVVKGCAPYGQTIPWLQRVAGRKSRGERCICVSIESPKDSNDGGQSPQQSIQRLEIKDLQGIHQHRGLGWSAGGL